MATDDKVDAAFLLLSSESQRSFFKVSCGECAAYMNWSHISKIYDKHRRLHVWNGMSAEDQEDWIPKEPAVYLKSLSYYKDSLTWTGWPIFFGWEEQRRYVPLWLPYCNPTAVTMLECKRLQRLLRAYFNSETFSFNLDLQNDLVRHVLDIYPYRPLDADRMLDIGQVMHGIAFFCKQHLGVAWV